MKLATRTFLWSLLPFTILLIGSFWAVQARVLAQVRQGLEASVRQAQVSMANSTTQAAERNRHTLRIVSQNPALKAVVQLMLSDRKDAQAHRTVEQQLQEIGTELGFDFLLASDSDGVPLAGVMRQEGELRPLDLSVERPQFDGFFSAAGHTYQITSVPIDQGDENLGTLSVGEAFSLAAVPGAAVLTRNGRIVEINVAGVSADLIESALSGCALNASCDVQLRGETFVSQPIETNASASGYQLRSFQSVAAAAGSVQSVVRRVFLFEGLAVLLAAVFISAVSSRSIARPIANVIDRLHESARSGELPEFDSSRERVQEIRELTQSFNRAANAIREGREHLQRANVEFIESLASALDARDPYTAGHSRRVSQYACAAAQAMGLSPAEIQNIRVGALLHDIGKIGIADAILQKPDRLTPEEDAIIRQHPVIGRHILEGVNGFQPYLDVVELHHENWDGSGYPRGLREEETPLSARVVKVADAWDAMTSDRPYRMGMSRNQALAMLRKVAGTQTDPVVTEVFCGLWSGEEKVAVTTEAESLARLAAAVQRDIADVPVSERSQDS